VICFPIALALGPKSITHPRSFLSGVIQNVVSTSYVTRLCYEFSRDYASSAEITLNATTLLPSGMHLYKYKLKCLYGENSKTGSVKVPVKFFGRSAAVKVTFTPKKYFYGAPKNGARGP
jgi:hypothetical protein